MVIIDKKTGVIVGAFDAVVGDNKSERVGHKNSKTFLENYCQNGGTLKYGINIVNNKITLSTRNNVPVFYLDLSRAELLQGINKINFLTLKLVF